MENKIPVSVVVLSFNSESTIEQTLDSIANQTYPLIELIISDDCSVDDTVKVASDWSSKHEDRFIDIKIIQADYNKGTSVNVNTGVSHCKNEWIKIIAADDLLSENCLTDCINYVYNNNYQIIQTNEMIINSFGDNVGVPICECNRMRYMSRLKTAEEQYRYLLLDDIRLSPTLFFNKSTFLNVGGCDTRIKYIEDYPLKLRFLKNGYKMGYLPITTVNYRVGNSVSHVEGRVYSNNHLEQKHLVKKLCCNPYIPWYNLAYWFSEWVEHVQEYIVIKVFNNKRSFLCRCFMRFIYIINPRDIHNRKMS